MTPCFIDHFSKLPDPRIDHLSVIITDDWGSYYKLWQVELKVHPALVL